VPPASGPRAGAALGSASVYGVVKLAVTAVASFMLTVQVLAVPVHAPLQPTNAEPATALAVNFTELPLLNTALQLVPHEMPAGEDVTVPLAVLTALSMATVSTSGRLKAAFTDRLAVMLTVQVLAVPVQPPLQPVNVVSAPALAVRITDEPLS